MLLASSRLIQIESARSQLKGAARSLKIAGAINALAAVRRAQKSVDGAARHAARIDNRPGNRTIRKACPRRDLSGIGSRIAAQLDRQQWTPETLDVIAGILRRAGYPIRDLVI